MTLSRLVNGTAYELKIRYFLADNRSSPWSPSQTVTPRPAPAKEYSVKVTYTLNGKKLTKEYVIKAMTGDQAKAAAIDMAKKEFPKATGIEAAPPTILLSNGPGSGAKLAPSPQRSGTPTLKPGK